MTCPRCVIQHQSATGPSKAISAPTASARDLQPITRIATSEKRQHAAQAIVRRDLTEVPPLIHRSNCTSAPMAIKASHTCSRRSRRTPASTACSLPWPTGRGGNGVRLDGRQRDRGCLQPPTDHPGTGRARAARGPKERHSDATGGKGGPDRSGQAEDVSGALAHLETLEAPYRTQRDARAGFDTRS